MSSKEQITQKITDVFVKEFGIDRNLVKPEAKLFEELDLDSIDAIDLAVKLETETGIKLVESELRSIRTVQDVVEVISQRTAKAR
ncbi:MAG: acyl carrier protein [Elusimicrobia bacterium GWA2_69_24]|nr:MAG: acyl carrier protein [Elusimicrobia bacterium GWA2_69_24]HBL16470.1 acyl carrier protein [Elusimicrobiota bacterium]